MAAVFEIIELQDGDIALRRLDGEGDSIVKISFSDTAKAFFADNHLDIARVMLEAGVKKVGELSGVELTEEDLIANTDRVLH